MAKVVTGLRPGGRSERIQTAVHQAVKELQKDFEQSQITIPMIAAQAGLRLQPFTVDGVTSINYFQM